MNKINNGAKMDKSAKNTTTAICEPIVLYAKKEKRNNENNEEGLKEKP